MCKYSFIKYNKYTPLKQYVSNKGNRVEEGIWDLVLCAQFFCKSKTVKSVH